ncbi:MAG TPA: hypothetical protein VK427_01510 [Kofleriaceae bacterium]|nr:hypothetical protein [Kofleriaceae bacterium]
MSDDQRLELRAGTPDSRACGHDLTCRAADTREHELELRAFEALVPRERCLAGKLRERISCE